VDTAADVAVIASLAVVWPAAGLFAETLPATTRARLVHSRPAEGVVRVRPMSRT
jgi:hypothetical protein